MHPHTHAPTHPPTYTHLPTPTSTYISIHLHTHTSASTNTYTHTCTRRLAETNQVAEEALSLITTVRTFGAEHRCVCFLGVFWVLGVQGVLVGCMWVYGSVLYKQACVHGIIAHVSVPLSSPDYYHLHMLSYYDYNTPLLLQYTIAITIHHYYYNHHRHYNLTTHSLHREQNRYARQLQKLRYLGLRFALAYLLYLAANSTLYNLNKVVTLFMGGYLLSQGTITGQQLMTFVLYVDMVDGASLVWWAGVGWRGH